MIIIFIGIIVFITLGFFHEKIVKSLIRGINRQRIKKIPNWSYNLKFREQLKICALRRKNEKTI